MAPIDRLVQQKDGFGNSKSVIKRVVLGSLSVCVLTSHRPFVIDLESTNGTHVNGEAIPTSRYYELKASDDAFKDIAITRARLLIVCLVLKFGTSNREYVLLHDEAS